MHIFFYRCSQKLSLLSIFFQKKNRQFNFKMNQNTKTSKIQHLLWYNKVTKTTFDTYIFLQKLSLLFFFFLKTSLIQLEPTFKMNLYTNWSKNFKIILKNPIYFKKIVYENPPQTLPNKKKIHPNPPETRPLPSPPSPKRAIPLPARARATAIPPQCGRGTATTRGDATTTAPVRSSHSDAGRRAGNTRTALSYHCFVNTHWRIIYQCPPSGTLEHVHRREMNPTSVNLYGWVRQDRYFQSSLCKRCLCKGV